MHAELEPELVHRLRLGPPPTPAALARRRRFVAVRRTVPGWVYGALASILGVLAVARIMTMATIR